MSSLFAFSISLSTSFLASAEMVSYRDYDANTGTFTNAVRECTIVTDMTQTMTTGWYVVKGTVVCKTSRAPEVWGDVHFILCDGASYTVEKAEDRSSGIYVISNNSFTVYGQTAGTGRLWAKGGRSGAGIGSGLHNRCGTVTINGGVVTAIGGDIPSYLEWDWYGGAGIGGGYGAQGGIVTINGGTVTATGAERGAGIGGGYGAAGGTLTVNGGTVTATGGESDGGTGGAGIGGGEGGEGGVVTINGGTVMATGDWNSAGIGGSRGEGGVVTINGGTVTAQGGYNGAGIGGGLNKAGGEVTINGGTVTAQGGTSAAGIGGGWNGAGGIVTVTGGAVRALAGERKEDAVSPEGIGHGERSSNSGTGILSGGIFARPVKREWCTDHADLFDNPDPATREAYPYAVLPVHKVDLGEHPGISAAWTCGDGTATNAIGGTFFRVRPGTENVRVLFAAPDPFALVGDAEVNLGTVTGDVTFGGESDCRLPRVACPYLDYDWVSGQMTNAIVWAERCTVVTNDMPELADGGWYAVTNAVAFGEWKRLEVVGAAHLILCDNASLTIAKPGSNNAAVSVGDAASLSIYAQTAGSGRLEVNGGAYAAGIGGDLYVAGGAVTINGGIVTATGGDCAAGIGGGDMAAGGVVAIQGGRVTARGGSGAEDIGRGARGGEGGTVAITGGLFWDKPADAWIVAGCEAVANADETTKDAYPWAVRDRRFRVTPGQRSQSFTERSSAEAAMSWAVISPSRDVAAVLTTDEALNRYADWFTFRIVVTHDLVRYYYAIEAVLTDAAKARLAETATAATRLIPVADIAALTEGTKDVTVTNCEPGFYYTLFGAQGLSVLPATETKYGPELSGVSGEVTFPEVKKPSDAAGFFRVGVSEAK